MDSKPLYNAMPYGGTEYGGVQFGGGMMAAQDDEVSSFAAPKRKRLNGLALLECILLPWGIFVGVLYVLSFSVHYDHAEATWCLVFMGLCISLGFALKWYWHHNDGDYTNVELHSWYIYLAAACFVAWLSGLVLGQSNFGNNMQRYYDVSSMGLSRDVDPQAVSGDAILDTSRVFFKQGSYVQQDRAMGFKDASTYCVAPIIAGNQSSGQPIAYSYWAVGVDCCTPMPPSAFWCGSDVFDPAAHAALRWTGGGTNYRRAIEMAEAEYGIKAHRPLFFTWMKDPEAETVRYRDAGVHFFHACIWLYLAFQIVSFVGLAGFYWRNYLAVVGKRSLL